jgi:hypothetical protein
MFKAEYFIFAFRAEVLVGNEVNGNTKLFSFVWNYFQS